VKRDVESPFPFRELSIILSREDLMKRTARLRPAVVSSIAVAFLTLSSVPAWTAGGDGQDQDRAHARPRHPELAFGGDGHTAYGEWHADVSLSRSAWSPGELLLLDVVFRFSDTHLAGLAGAGIKADKLCLLVTAERTFDADGWMRLPSDERMSTLLTPTGLAIEGGVQGAATDRYGYAFKSPFDQLRSVSAATAQSGDVPGTRTVTFSMTPSLPPNLPPGLYRLRFDFGVTAGTRVYNFNGFAFAARPSSDEAGTNTYFYSPVIPASGTHAAGRKVDGATVQARCPWLLLAGYNSNGYRGVVADEDRHRFATSDRSLIPDEVVLPMFDDGGNRVSYSLEPQFPADGIDARQNIAWEWTTGELSVRVAGPDGSVVDLGRAPFVAKSGNGPTTRVTAITAWKPPLYGRYTVTAAGWIADRNGRRYEGGGTYRFWIAKRMTLATATFQGMPYPVGSSYGRDIQFNPAVPADVQVTASLYVNSNPDDVRTLTYSGKASPAGLFGAAQGMKPFPLNAPGEYHAQLLATYTDAEGHLWVSTMRHAGVVYPDPSPVVARGKKLALGTKYVDRGETRFEGYVEPNGNQHLAHITFPYLAGDVLLIGAEGQGANKIEPVLTYQMQGDASPWDTKLNGVGTTNLRIRTSNGYSPHLYPEYITDLEYYYGAAPRPGFMGRFLVGESTVRAPYWPVSPNSFGGQIGASPNGDSPGDIYRLIGGVVLRRAGADPMYAGYIASAFLLAKGTNNNRVVAAGSEDLNGPLGEKARFFLVGLRPGTAYEVGSSFRAAVQIDPLLPVSIHFVLTYPDGRQQVADGVGDRFGSFVGPAPWPLDVPGVYRYQLRATWNGFEGRMPGLPESGGELYVYSKTRPVGASGLRLDGASQRAFSATAGVTIAGTSTAGSIRYALLTPGAVIEQGDIPVRGGRFQYSFDPAAVHARVPRYDIVNMNTGKPQIGRVIHLTLFSQERAADGTTFHDVTRVILRGTTALSPRLPASAFGAATAAPESAALSGSGDSTATTAARAAVVPGARDLRTLTSGSVTRGSRPALTAISSDLVDRLLARGDLVMVRREDDLAVAGRHFERLQQHYRGIPVVGGCVTRHVEDDVTLSVTGTLYFGMELDVTPFISEADASAWATRHAVGQVASDRSPALVILPLGDDRYALAWEIEIQTPTDDRTYYIDATDGRRLVR
jgi:hypothetical protein